MDTDDTCSTQRTVGPGGRAAWRMRKAADCDDDSDENSDTDRRAPRTHAQPPPPPSAGIVAATVAHLRENADRQTKLKHEATRRAEEDDSASPPPWVALRETYRREAELVGDDLCAHMAGLQVAVDEAALLRQESEQRLLAKLAARQNHEAHFMLSAKLPDAHSETPLGQMAPRAKGAVGRTSEVTTVAVEPKGRSLAMPAGFNAALSKIVVCEHDSGEEGAERAEEDQG